jgi:hypothetical protein
MTNHRACAKIKRSDYNSLLWFGCFLRWMLKRVQHDGGEGTVHPHDDGGEGAVMWQNPNRIRHPELDLRIHRLNHNAPYARLRKAA